MYSKVIKIVNEYYMDGVTTYAGIWREYVNPVYPMSYATFIKIINTPNIMILIEKAEAKTK